VAVESTGGGSPLTVNVGNGNDMVNVSPTAGNLDTLGSVLTVNGAATRL